MTNQNQNQPEERKSSLIYNPTAEDFTISYDIAEDGKPVFFTVPAGEIERFDEPVASHIKKHLVDFILNKRGSINGNAELAKAKYLEEIEIKL